MGRTSCDFELFAPLTIRLHCFYFSTVFVSIRCVCFFFVYVQTFSISPVNKVNFSLTFSGRLSSKGSLEEIRVAPMLIEQNVHRVTYDYVDSILRGNIL